MHWSVLLVVVGLEHTLWVMIEWIETGMHSVKIIEDSPLGDESSTAPLKGRGPWLVYALTEMLYCTHSWSLFSIT